MHVKTEMNASFVCEITLVINIVDCNTQKESHIVFSSTSLENKTNF